MLKTLASVAAVLALTLGLSTPAHASLADKMTRFTFSQPIALPGVTLPAGTYVFKLADPTIERKVVQVLDENGMHSYALLQAIPTFRDDIANEPSVSLMETVPGMPAAVQSWWPQGESQGFEFLYSDSQFARLTGSDPAVIDGGGIAAVRAPAAAVPEFTVAQATPAQSVNPEPAATELGAESTRTELPATATPVPLIGFLGALTLLGGALLLSRSKA